MNDRIDELEKVLMKASDHRLRARIAMRWPTATAEELVEIFDYYSAVINKARHHVGDLIVYGSTKIHIKEHEDVRN